MPWASELARGLAEVLYPKAPKKGLITDLDDTLWAGLAGEIGPDAVSWHQADHAQVHGLYQQMLAVLADGGVLLGVCSKNEPAVVEAALAREDLFLDAASLFPVYANWGPKSASVAQVLKAWNIGADSVVFVDDNAMELAEVQQAFPEITCIPFPKKDPAKVWNLLGELRDLFGKPLVMEEDRLRSNSLRAGLEIRESSPDFLRSLDGTVTIDYRKNSADKRPLELINKTNQFNLNGLRISEGEWQRYLERKDTLLAVVSYQDKFGPLGKIAALTAEPVGACLRISHWVMSCRAFSRAIERHTLDSLFHRTGAAEIQFAFAATERNQPLQEFFRELGVSEDGWLKRSQFDLPHRVNEIL
jgi:FkbH-like protein